MPFALVDHYRLLPPSCAGAAAAVAYWALRRLRAL
jgi:hypothetical protein